MVRLAVIVGSTRPGRRGEAVARWTFELASRRTDAEVDWVDVADYDLPLLDESLPPSLGRYEHAHTVAWARAIAAFDGYIVVSPEYNHGIPGALKNALDFAYQEWNNKAAGFVGYGSGGGLRAVEQLRLVMAELQVATVRTQVSFSTLTDFEDRRIFRPGPQHESVLAAMLDELVAWSRALKTVRKPSAGPTA